MMPVELFYDLSMINHRLTAGSSDTFLLPDLDPPETFNSDQWYVYASKTFKKAYLRNKKYFWTYYHTKM